VCVTDPARPGEYNIIIKYICVCTCVRV
jgi:hypothetical protein